MRILSRSLLLGCFLATVMIGHAQKSDLRTYTLTVHAQQSPLGGHMVDLDRRMVYPLEEAGFNPERIDFGFMYGRNTGGNLMAPISSGFLTFGDKFKETFLRWGNDRNNGTFINLGNDDAAQAVFDRINHSDTLNVLYDEWFDKILYIDDYNPSKHGPSQRIRPIAIGDVMFFRSENKDTYHIFRINKFVQSGTGLVELEVKSPRKSRKRK